MTAPAKGRKHFQPFCTIYGSLFGDVTAIIRCPCGVRVPFEKIGRVVCKCGREYRLRSDGYIGGIIDVREPLS